MSAQMSLAAELGSALVTQRVQTQRSHSALKPIRVKDLGESFDSSAEVRPGPLTNILIPCDDCIYLSGLVLMCIGRVFGFQGRMLCRPRRRRGTSRRQTYHHGLPLCQ